MTVCNPAVRQADNTASVPAVWFSIAGTRPVACNPRNASAAPIEFGTISPIAPPCPACRASRRPSTRLALTTRS